MFKGKTHTGADVSNTFGFNEARAGSTWILVANRTGAKLFETHRGSKTLEFPKEFACAEGRIRGSDSYRDQPGRSFNSSSQSHGGHGTASPRHALGSETTHHEMVAYKFASTLAAMLEKAENSQSFSRLVLVAEPHFLGVLRGALSSQVKARIAITLEKDIEEMPNGLLGDHLVELLKDSNYK
jgi:protein required for attachment to host cells